ASEPASGGFRRSVARRTKSDPTTVDRSSNPTHPRRNQAWRQNQHQRRLQSSIQVFARPAPIADRQTEAGPHPGADFPSQFNLLGSIAEGPSWVPTHGILVRPLFSLEFTTWTGAGELIAATRFSITVRASDPSSFWPAST